MVSFGYQYKVYVISKQLIVDVFRVCAKGYVKDPKGQVNKTIALHALQSYKVEPTNFTKDLWNVKSLGFPYLVRYPTIISMIYQREKVIYFNNKNAITLMKAQKGKKENWAQIMFNNLCNKLDQWYKYVKENKGNKDTCQLTSILTKIFKYFFFQQKNNPKKPQTKVKRTRLKEMQVALENRRKIALESPKNVLKRKNIIQEGGAPRSRVKKEQESIEARAQKMMRRRMAPFVVPTLIHASKQNANTPQMSSPQDIQMRKQRQKIKRENDTSSPKVEG